MLSEYLVRRAHSQYPFFTTATLEKAEYEAKLRANANKDKMGVYKLVKTFNPEPKMVTRDIDEVLEKLKKLGEHSFTTDVLRALLQVRRTNGAQTIELLGPDKD